MSPPPRSGPNRAMADEYGAMNSEGETVVIEELHLESGRVLAKAECRYRAWGKLNERRDNAIVVCHALTGNANLEAWWGPLLGPGRPLDTNKYWVFCSNSLGSCYGSTGPASINPQTGRRYGSSFPFVTIRDMVRLQAASLEQLGVREIACVIGGSMGGMQALEWCIEVRNPRVRSLISLSSSGRHQPWQIGISECQRQSIKADPKWNDGNYSPDDPPRTGMAVARMMAMLTYRTHPAYWTKFGRGVHRASGQNRGMVFDVENYLHQQGLKFNERGFDPMAYVVLTRAMDSHDVERGRSEYFQVLRSVQVPTLVASISSDVLYPASEQLELAEHIPNAQHHMIESKEGHDGFLLEHRKVGTLIRGFLVELESPTLPQAKM
eukprot:TRINITY_DN51199_c0_g1_i1.p1 TRINITY_DN51199_c0_g1~~TRINITY_DN51199_c0_g1_i1.p1  ORF type:complete len:380 (+),score=104.82 TRINITY_DN51199_c0_g1_i1:72-1211(+)